MSKELFRLAGKLFNSPQLATQDLMSHAVEYVANRCGVGGEGLTLADSPYKGKRKDRVRYDESTATGFIEMDGPITYVPMVGMSVGEGLSHKMVKEEVQGLLDRGASTIVLDQDSGGGEAYGTFETAVDIRNLCDDYEAKLIAYVDGTSASASYAYTAVAHESVMNPGSRVGSIGVVLRLRNFNKRMKMMGVEDTYIYAGDSKIPFDEEGDWTEDFKKDLQESVDELYTEFTSHVAMWRGIDQEDVVKTEAKMFNATKAKSLGLVDSIMTREDFLTYLGNRDAGEDKTEEKKMALFNKKEEESPDMANKLSELQTQVEELTNALAVKETEFAEALGNVQTLEEQLTSKGEELAEALSEVESLKEQMKTNTENSRKEKMTAVVGTEQAEALSDIYSELSDEKFDKFLTSYESKAKAEEESALFNELGEEGGEIDASADKQETKKMTAGEQLRAKYQSKTNTSKETK